MYNIIILGSGRSGTSMLTGVLANSGYYTGKKSDYLKKNKANAKGFFEDYEVNTINEDILKENLINIPESIRKRFFPSATFYRARWLAKLPLNKVIKSTQQINSRIEAVLKNQPFCYKDPRFSYTLPIWNQFLDANTKYIVVFREPDKTANSIVRECNENSALKKLKMTKPKALEVWISMYSHILRNYRQSAHQKNWMFFHYNQIFDKHKISKLESFIDLSLDVDFAEKQLSRSSVDSKRLDIKIETIYNELIKLS